MRETEDEIKHSILVIISCVALIIYCNKNLEYIAFKQVVCDFVIIGTLVAIIAGSLTKLLK